MAKDKKPIERKGDEQPPCRKTDTESIHIKRYSFKIQGDAIFYSYEWWKSKVYKTTVEAGGKEALSYIDNRAAQ